MTGNPRSDFLTALCGIGTVMFVYSFGWYAGRSHCVDRYERMRLEQITSEIKNKE